MEDRVRLQELDDCIALSFDAGDEKIMAIGSKMQEMCEAAYMNGYNWEAFINAYLEQNAPDILEELDSDPEAEMYSVYINDTGDAGKAVAEKLKKMLDELFDNEDEIYAFLEQNSDDIEWD
ncbi:MAG: immunity 51 family protein [Lachnospiraceae bacterium]|nr:immunity 51 family protein [Lachnospiraceae bacterium]